MSKGLAIHSNHNHSYLYQQKIQWQNLNFQLCANYLRKVSLKVDDVKMKLALKKIITFIQSQSSAQVQHKKGILKHNHHENDANISNCDRPNRIGNHLASNQQSRQLSFANAQTVKSLADESMLLRQSRSLLQQQQEEMVHFASLNCKSAVTRNDLSQKMTSTIVREQDHFDVQQLVEENKKLSNCLKRMFCLLQDKKIIDMSKSLIHQHKKGTYSEIVDSISQNFEYYQLQIQIKINQLTQYTKQLEKSLHLYNISIDNKLQPSSTPENTCNMTQSKQIQASCLDEQSKQIQAEQTGSVNYSDLNVSVNITEPEAHANQANGELSKQYDAIKEQLQAELQNIHKYEMLVFIKDQQIEALNIVVNDLKNKLAIYQKPLELTMKKSYKKFFDITGQNLHKTAI